MRRRFSLAPPSRCVIWPTSSSTCSRSRPCDSPTKTASSLNFASNVTLGSRPFGLLAVYLFALIAYAIGNRFMDGPLPFWALSMAITQITYISAWWAMLRTDEVMQERTAVTENARMKLSVYKPHEGETEQ